MRKFLVTVLLFGACGLEPILQPVGCNGKWVCICTDSGCDWILICQN